MRKHILIISSLALIFSLESCSSTHTPMKASEATATSLTTADNALWQSNSNLIWDKLQSQSPNQLRASLAHNTNPTAAAWMKLALISKQYSANTPELIKQLEAWREQNPNHPGNTLFPDNATLNSINTAPPKHIALLLPLQGPFAAQGKAIRDGFMRSYYADRGKTTQLPALSFIDTSQNSDIAALYQQAVSQGADFIIGPLTKDQVQALTQSRNFPATTLALNYTETSSLPNNFYEFGLSPLDEAMQIADKAREEGRTRALIIAPQNEWGKRTAKALLARWENNGGKVTDSLYYSSDTNLSKAIPELLHINTKADRELMKEDNNKKKLSEQRRQDFDTIFLLAQSKEGRQIVPLLRYYYADNIPIYSTSAIYSGVPNPQRDTDLNGVIFCDVPWLLRANSNANTNRLFAVGYDSHMLTKQLPRLSALQNFPVYAATGALTMTPQHQIYRRLPWATIHGGHI